MTAQFADQKNFGRNRMQWYSAGFAVRAAGLTEIDCLQELVVTALGCAAANANPGMLCRGKK